MRRPRRVLAVRYLAGFVAGFLVANLCPDVSPWVGVPAAVILGACAAHLIDKSMMRRSRG